ncbi:hypothetical protein F2P47_12030 [Parvibaculum sedimenti]|uniref:Uncharacterized protein n=3 Tax=Parvibaculum sedimenti TaxID=2608632 RepID=A0A6N6VGQ4_9HYPH|nr:hypothetical protein [Parvibaculum sedimenti]KAB7739443.1 hypothetical protein F2P47_12030 [Parvibaculum sedimenti]
MKLDSAGNMRPSEAAILASLIEEQAMQPGMPFATADAQHKYSIAGAVDAGPTPKGTYLVAVLDIRSPNGVALHRIVEEDLIAKGNGAGLTRSDLTQVASGAVAKLAAWHIASLAAGRAMAGREPGDMGPDATGPDAMGPDAMIAAGPDDDITTGSISHGTQAVSPGSRLRFDIDMGPAPGDGREALAAALGDALRRRAPTPQWNAGHYIVRGEVALSSTADAEPSLAIQWQVMTDDGRLVGTVIQANAVNPARVATRWGTLAGQAGEAAASGVLSLLTQPAKGA